ncbi:MAG: hypothetical protein IT372_17130 [Polyangiaceae bacterium]|nr:hypothetical protein [Polyangiaceae bacterium]
MDRAVAALSEMSGVDVAALLDKLAGAAEEARLNDRWSGYLASNEFTVPRDAVADVAPLSHDAPPMPAAPATADGARPLTYSDFPDTVTVVDEHGNRYTFRWNADPNGPDWVLTHVEYVNQPADASAPEAPLADAPAPAKAAPAPRPFKHKLEKMYGGYDVPTPEEPPSIFDTSVYGDPAGQPTGMQDAGGPPLGGGAPPVQASLPPANVSTSPASPAPTPVGAMPGGGVSPGAGAPAGGGVSPGAGSPAGDRSMRSAPVGGAGPWSGGGGSPAPGGPGGDPAGVGPPPGGVDLPAPADDWTRARQAFSGFIEGIGEAAAGTAGQVAKNTLYMFPIAGQVLFAYDVYESAQRHGGGLGGAFVGLNEMFNPAYGAISAGVDAYDALQAGDDRKLGNRLFHLGAGILATAALVEGGPGGLKEGPAAPGGAGVPWKTIEERPSSRVVRQNYPNACGPACAASILRERGGALRGLTQEEVMAAAGERYNPHGGIQARDLASVMSELDPDGQLSWRADLARAPNVADAVKELSAEGPWIASVPDHYVIVNGIDESGNVHIRDPAGGGMEYTVAITEFARFWTLYYVGPVR